MIKMKTYLCSSYRTLNMFTVISVRKRKRVNIDNVNCLLRFHIVFTIVCDSLSSVCLKSFCDTPFFVVSENRTFELHSPDGVHSCILRAAEANDAASWFNSLHSALYVLTMKALQEANKVLSPTLIGGELHHIGWLSTRKQRLNFSVEVIKFDPLPAGLEISV